MTNDILQYEVRHFPALEQSKPIAEEIINLLLSQKISYFVAHEALEIAMSGIKSLSITNRL